MSIKRLLYQRNDGVVGVVVFEVNHVAKAMSYNPITIQLRTRPVLVLFIHKSNSISLASA